MAIQFCYQDSHGTLYPEHPALYFQPDLVPGHYDTDKGTFTPTGNPTKKVGNIITDGGHDGNEKLLSGLSEDKGADTAPVKGVVISKAESEKRDDDMLELVGDEPKTQTPKRRVVRKA